MKASTRNTPRNEFVQASRFVAAAMVLLTHITFYRQERVEQSASIWHVGEIGVPIFFLISGFVIVISSDKLPANGAGAREFIARRLLRILPLYWLVTFVKIGIALGIPAAVNHNHFDLAHAIKSLLLIPTYNAAGEIRPIHGVGWTLLHEMVFYLVFASMMVIRVRPALACACVLLSLCVLGRAYPPDCAFMTVATSQINLYFIVGMSIGAATIRAADAPAAKRALSTGLLVMAIAGFVAPVSTKIVPLDPVVLLIGCAMLLFGSRKLPAALQLPVTLGSSSYALYLFHPIIAPGALILIHQVASGMGAPAEIAVAASLTVALSHGIHRWVELPLTQWAARAWWRSPNGMPSISEAQ